MIFHSNSFLRRKLPLLLALGALAISFGAETASAENGRQVNLSECIDLAMKNNHDISQSASDRETAAWSYKAARRNMGPRLVWQSSAKKIGGKAYEQYREAYEQGAPGITAYNKEFVNDIALEMPLYTGGEREGQIDSTRYGLNIADMSLENTRQTTRYQVAAAYYQLLQRKAMVEVEEEAVETLRKHLETVTIGYEEGVIAKSDVLASRVQLTNREQALATAQGDYTNAMGDLALLIGLPTEEPLYAKEELTYKKYGRTFEDSLAYALENRPDGVADSYAVKRAERAVNTAKAGYRPSVVAVANKDLSGEEAFKDNHSESWSAGLQLSWNIFDNGVTASQVSAAKNELAKTKSRLAQTREQIRLDVRKAYNDLTTAEQNIKRTQTAVNIAKEDYALVQLRYKEGIDTNLAVMDAQDKITEAQVNYLSALYKYNASMAAMDKAIGVPIGLSVPQYVQSEADGNGPQKVLRSALLEQSGQKQGVETP